MPHIVSGIYRYQGAIVNEQQILLIRHKEPASGQSYWLLPGGGKEDGETEEGCVIREIREETHLEVKVERLLLFELWEDEARTRGCQALWHCGGALGGFA